MKKLKSREADYIPELTLTSQITMPSSFREQEGPWNVPATDSDGLAVTVRVWRDEDRYCYKVE